MAAAKNRPHETVSCATCGVAVHRTYALVALLRSGRSEFEAATVAVGYCREHRRRARAELFVRLRGLGEVVAHTRPVVVRPWRLGPWNVKALRLARHQWHESLGEQVRAPAPPAAPVAYPVEATGPFPVQKSTEPESDATTPVNS